MLKVRSLLKNAWGWSLNIIRALRQCRYWRKIERLIMRKSSLWTILTRLRRGIRFIIRSWSRMIYWRLGKRDLRRRRMRWSWEGKLMSIRIWLIIWGLRELRNMRKLLYLYLKRHLQKSSSKKKPKKEKNTKKPSKAKANPPPPKTKKKRLRATIRTKTSQTMATSKTKSMKTKQSMKERPAKPYSPKNSNTTSTKRRRCSPSTSDPSTCSSFQISTSWTSWISIRATWLRRGWSCCIMACWVHIRRFMMSSNLL